MASAGDVNGDGFDELIVSAQGASPNGTGELLACMRHHPELIGNTFLPGIHGGTLFAMLEMAAIFQLLWETETDVVPKIVNITVDYLRSAGLVDVIACAKVVKQEGAWSTSCRSLAGRPITTGRDGEFPLPVKSDADAPPSL